MLLRRVAAHPWLAPSEAIEGVMAVIRKHNSKNKKSTDTNKTQIDVNQESSASPATKDAATVDLTLDDLTKQLAALSVNSVEAKPPTDAETKPPVAVGSGRIPRKAKEIVAVPVPELPPVAVATAATAATAPQKNVNTSSKTGTTTSAGANTSLSQSDLTSESLSQSRSTSSLCLPAFSTKTLSLLLLLQSIARRDRGAKVVVFSHWTAVLTAVEQALAVGYEGSEQARRVFGVGAGDCGQGEQYREREQGKSALTSDCAHMQGECGPECDDDCNGSCNSNSSKTNAKNSKTKTGKCKISNDDNFVEDDISGFSDIDYSSDSDDADNDDIASDTVSSRASSSKKKTAPKATATAAASAAKKEQQQRRQQRRLQRLRSRMWFTAASATSTAPLDADNDCRGNSATNGVRNVFRIDGSMSKAAVELELARFKAYNHANHADAGGGGSNSSAVLLVSLAMAGVGLNLVEASHAVLLEPAWNPAAEKQAVDRVNRVGQRREVTVWQLRAVPGDLAAVERQGGKRGAAARAVKAAVGGQ